MAGTDPRGYETRDLNVRSIVIITLASIAALIVVLYAVHALFGQLSARAARNQPRSISLIPRESNPLPPAPQLQNNPWADLKAHRQEEAAKADGYAWLDRGTGRVRIPVSRAMELLVEREGATR